MLLEEHKLKLKTKYSYWFDEHSYIVDWESMEFILSHIRIYAKNKKTGITDSFFMTDSKLTMRVGFNRDHKVLVDDRYHRPNKIEEMRRAIE